MQKVLLTGATGRVGRVLYEQLNRSGFNVSGLGSKDVNITKPESVRALFTRESPDIVINCAAISRIEVCEQDEDAAYRVNAIGARNVSAAAYECGASIVHLSTDCVFGGEPSHAPYREDDPVSPVNVYGRSKLYGEQFIKETNPRHLIVRTAAVFATHEDFILRYLQAAREQTHIEAPEDQIATPTHAQDLAQALINCIQEGQYGTFHVVNEGPASRYEIALETVRLAGLNTKVTATRMFAPGAKKTARPQCTPLSNTMLHLTGAAVMPTWQDALTRYVHAIT